MWTFWLCVCLRRRVAEIKKKQGIPVHRAYLNHSWNFLDSVGSIFNPKLLLSAEGVNQTQYHHRSHWFPFIQRGSDNWWLSVLLKNKSVKTAIRTHTPTTQLSIIKFNALDHKAMSRHSNVYIYVFVFLPNNYEWALNVFCSSKSIEINMKMVWHGHSVVYLYLSMQWCVWIYLIT